jgi:hypothetical protein
VDLHNHWLSLGRASTHDVADQLDPLPFIYIYDRRGQVEVLRVCGRNDKWGEFSRSPLLSSKVHNTEGLSERGTCALRPYPLFVVPVS